MTLPILNKPSPCQKADSLESLPLVTLGGVPPRPLPMSVEEMRNRGWDEADVVFVTGDAYIDHPSFAMAILGRVLEAAGFRVAIVSQPDWRNCDAWRRFGRPRLFFAISAGNMDSMINHYTANRKVRNSDAYSPGGRIGLRPDRATRAYCQRAREAYKGVPVIAGGVEASLRRLAHYDYWSDKVCRSILLDCKADLLVYGMGEDSIVEIARRLAAGESVRDLREMRGAAYAMGASETPPTDAIVLPSFEQVRDDKPSFAEATKIIHNETNPYNARRLVQWHDRQAVVANPPPLPVSQGVMDRIYGFAYTRRPHPSYSEPIPAYTMIKDSVTIMRGCFGGCTFCSITAHQGRIIQSRSKDSVLAEVRDMTRDEGFSGVISDIGGPTANMYEMQCSRPEVEAVCRRQSCVHPTICKLLDTDHAPLIDLMKEARQTPGIRKVLVASGIRMDLARRSPEYLAVFLKRSGYKPDQVPDFIPAPFDVATAMYYTGIDPFTKKPVHIARQLRDRKLQRALMQFFKPENYFEVREALRQAGRHDLIGSGCDCLISATPPREAISARRKEANSRFRGDYVHTIPGEEPAPARRKKSPRKQSRHAPGNAYRPDQKAAVRPTSPRKKDRPPKG
ncbi:MAG: YgiQ family radical SAM protein [Planctomycetia bacterium]|nr:YgiQ family radical SAM protein [Planctomycetia bacterium]